MADEEGGTANGVDWLLNQHSDLIDAAVVINHDGSSIVSEHGKPQYYELDGTEKIYGDFQLMVTNPGGCWCVSWLTRVSPSNGSTTTAKCRTKRLVCPPTPITGIAIDRDDVRAHGRDERLGVESFYKGNEFFYQ